MHTMLDILVSGVHDAKNQLFVAESLIAEREARHGIDLAEARYAIEAAANRLSRTLATYRLLRDDARLSITPTIIADLCDEVALAQRAHLANAAITLEIDCTVVDEWLLDRDLVTDMLNNAIHNASRYARQSIRLSARIEDDWLILAVDDDGPGIPEPPPTQGTGLAVASRLAELHTRHGRHGCLRLDNSSPLGGARFALRLP